MIPEVNGESLLIRSDGNHIKTEIRFAVVRGVWGVHGDTHNWSPLKSPNATTLPSVSSPRDPAPSKAFPLNRFGGNGHMANVSGSHSKVESRGREDRRTRMVGVYSPVSEPESSG